MSMKNSTESFGNQTPELPACSAVSQPAGSQRDTNETETAGTCSKSLDNCRVLENPAPLSIMLTVAEIPNGIKILFENKYTKNTHRDFG
jgi:hypothetical protein